MNGDRVVTVPAAVLGELMAAGDGIVRCVLARQPEGYPLGLHVVALLEALRVAEAAILEAR